MKSNTDLIAARTKAQAKYDKDHTTGFYMKLIPEQIRISCSGSESRSLNKGQSNA